MKHKTVTGRIKRCKKCQGTGKIRVGNLREMHNCDIEICPDCKDDGFFYRVTTVEWFKITDEIRNSLIPVG